MSKSDSKEKNGVTLVSVAGIVLDPTTQAPVVLLQTEDGKVQLPIWIGMAEATSIAASIKKLKLNRPLTHDLFINVLDGFDAEIEQAVITSIQESTYFSELVLSSGERAIIIDCRPSDAIAIALRSGAPIYVTEDVLKSAANHAAFQKLKAPAISQEKSQKITEKQSPAVKDLQYIDKSRWEDILKELDADDLKYEA